MRYFDRKTSFLLLFFCLPLLFLPKVNLLSFAGRETAGIRIDDIILFFLSVIVFWANFALEKQLKGIERWILRLVLFSVMSFFLNRLFVKAGWLHVDANILYALRIFEYFLFFYIGAIAFRLLNVTNVIKTFFAWNLVILLMQKAELIGQFSGWGYLPVASERVSGIASFPSEAGLLLNMIFCFLIYNKEKSSKAIQLLPAMLRPIIEKTYTYWMFLLCSYLVILTGSRIAVVAMVLAFLFKLKEELNWRSIYSILGIALFLTFTALFMTNMILNSYALFERSAGLLSVRNLELISLVWEQIDLSHDPIGVESVSFKNYDVSWWMRIHKWCYALKIYYLHPECYLQGVGPGFAMAGLDGGFLRIFTEYGIIGCVLFWKVFAPIYRMNKQLKWMMISLLVNMIFFDVYLAYKPMSLLFFITGYAYSVSEERIKAPILAAPQYAAA